MPSSSPVDSLIREARATRQALRTFELGLGRVASKHDGLRKTLDDRFSILLERIARLEARLEEREAPKSTKRVAKSAKVPE